MENTIVKHNSGLMLSL